MSGRKFEPVSTWSGILAAKEKLAGERLNSAGIDWLNQPVAETRGFCPLVLKLGTRGIVKASTMPMLERKGGLAQVQRGRQKHDVRGTEPKEREHDCTAGEPFATEQPVLSTVEHPPLLPEILLVLLPAPTLCHVLQLVLAPLRAQCRYGNQLDGPLSVGLLVHQLPRGLW